MQACDFSFRFIHSSPRPRILDLSLSGSAAEVSGKNEVCACVIFMVNGHQRVFKLEVPKEVFYRNHKVRLGCTCSCSFSPGSNGLFRLSDQVTVDHLQINHFYRPRDNDVIIVLADNPSTTDNPFKTDKSLPRI